MQPVSFALSLGGRKTMARIAVLAISISSVGSLAVIYKEIGTANVQPAWEGQNAVASVMTPHIICNE